MNILVLTSYWPQHRNPGNGIFVVQQLEELAKRCDTVTVVVARGRRSLRGELQYFSLPANIEIIPAQFFALPRSLPTSETNFFYNLSAARRALAKQLHANSISLTQYDAILLHDVRFAALSISHILNKVSAPITVIIHGFDSFLSRHVESAWLQKELKRLWKQSTLVAPVGRPLLDYCCQLGVPSDKVEIVHNGTTPPERTPQERNRSGPIQIISVSNLVDWKGVDFNLRALSQIKREHPALAWQYTVVGAGPQRKSLEKLTAALELQDFVRFIGRPSYAETMSLISHSDIFSLPSWGEPFGIVYLEAMARRCAAIGCLGQGAAETIRHGETGLLVQPKCVSDLRDKLLLLLTNQGLRKQLGEAGVSTAAKFGWGRNVDTLLNFAGVQRL